MNKKEILSEIEKIEVLIIENDKKAIKRVRKLKERLKKDVYPYNPFEIIDKLKGGE